MRPDHRPVRYRRISSLLTAAVLTVSVAGCSHHNTSYVEFCKQVKKVPPMAAVISGYTEADRQELEKRLTSTRALYAKLVKVAPDEIKSDVQAVVSLVDIVIDAVAQNPGDQVAVARQVQDRLGNEKEVQASTARMAVAARDHCGISLTPTQATGSATGGSTTTAVVTTTTGG